MFKPNVPLEKNKMAATAAASLTCLRAVTSRAPDKIYRKARASSSREWLYSEEEQEGDLSVLEEGKQDFHRAVLHYRLSCILIQMNYNV